MGKVREYYIKPAHARVIYNGRTPQLFDPSHAKESVVLSVGRLWDSGKQVQLLLTREHAAPVWIAGPVDHPEKTGRVEAGFNANGLRLWGEQSQDQLLSLFAQASIYAATSRYEPFGLAPVEAALSGCALVANDIPVFRELWGEAAVYFSKDDPDALAERIRELVRDPELRHDCARRAYERARLKFTAERMADEYDAAYHRISSLTEKAA